MTTFDVSAACIDLEIDVLLDDLSIIFPGGAVLEIPSPPGVDVAFAIDYAKQILSAASAALMPLQPIFNIIETLMAIADFCKLVPEILGPPPDPTKLFEAVPKIFAKLDKLLAIIPPLSVPFLIKGILKVLIVMLSGLKAALQAIIDLLLEATAAEERAAFVLEFSAEASLQLGAAAECVRANAAIAMRGLGQGLKPVDSLLKLLKLFVEMIGLPVKIPTIATLGADAQVAVDALDGLITVLSGIKAAIVI